MNNKKYEKMLLEEKFLKISTTFFLIFDPVCISIFNNYISKEVIKEKENIK